VTGKCIKYGEIEGQSRRVASALTRRGFKKGDILNYVTYESAEMYVVQMAVWRLGGALRGSNQFGEPGTNYYIVNIQNSFCNVFNKEKSIKYSFFFFLNNSEISTYTS
jgi:acyl-coenzyme A synthetase/AMP-(fatty) acid ligase